MPKRYWLMKSEPTSYSIDDLKRDKQRCGKGFELSARNLMKEMKVAMTYSSIIQAPSHLGLQASPRLAVPPSPTRRSLTRMIATLIRRLRRPSNLALRSSEVQTEVFREVALPELREQKALQNMVLLRKGSRLSVQPVTEKDSTSSANLFSKSHRCEKDQGITRGYVIPWIRETGLSMIAPSQFIDFPERFDSSSARHISGSAATLDGCGQSFEPRKALFHILPAWL